VDNFNPNIQDIANLIERKDEIQHPEKKKKGRGHWKDKERINKLKANAKWDSRLAEMATRLIAAGITYEEIGNIIGVTEHTIAAWTQRYPDFKAAAEAGHQAANAITLGQLLRSAWGYDYTEKTIKRCVTLDKDGEEIPSEENKAVVTEHFKSQPPNADLLKFIALNRMKDEFSDTKRLEINENRRIEITGLDEEKRLDEFISNFVEHLNKTKQIDCKVIDEERIIDQPPKVESNDSNGRSGQPALP